MYRKNCDKCNRPSYSSAERGEWFCPVCNNDLTKYPFFDAMTFEKIHINYSFKKVLSSYRNQYIKKETRGFTGEFDKI